ncbi:MAG: VWA domain-containing protein [Alphaproteobacteria bacterium]|nr:VWA domain-containing protein [Alphaproteobacteria bacterium]MCZ6846161.1 VWA domain-containing protein [Alphaproteobacteria bacterium]
MHFGRVLRAAGLPVGPAKVLDAFRAVEAVGLGNRQDFYWTLHAVFVNRRDQREIFDQAFHIFWRNPRLLERMTALVLPSFVDPTSAPETEEINRRLAEALKGDQPNAGEDGSDEDDEPDVTVDAVMTWSAREVLQDMDFEKMSSDELNQVKRAIARMRLPIMEVPTRRFHRDPSGTRIDMRATLRSALRSGGATIPLQYRKRRRRHPPLVVLCDISGSMSRYSRMILHFLHAITNDRDRVHTFLFGTRLTNVTRYLRYKDVDDALDRVSEAVDDWSGGTRIGHCLRDFNIKWSRRTLSQGAVVLLITDGLDRDAAEGLEDQIERIHKSCRRLIWLNPLLRYDRYEPKSLGARALLPHVDDFRSVHNLQSLQQLADVLSRPSVNDTNIRRMLEAAA